MIVQSVIIETGKTAKNQWRKPVASPRLTVDINAVGDVSVYLAMRAVANGVRYLAQTARTPNHLCGTRRNISAAGFVVLIYAHGINRVRLVADLLQRR